jgi:hypothetical protein
MSELKQFDDLCETILPIEDTLVDGIYTRIMYTPANCLVLGVEHKKGGTAVLLKGTIRIIDGTEKYEISAPHIYNTEAGSQKVGYSLTEVAFATMHSVEAKTIEEAEKELFVHTPQITRIRNSYKELLLEYKTDNTTVCKAMDSLPVYDEDSETYYIGESLIDGYGCFSKKHITKGEIIAMAVVDNKRLPTARYINHSDNPNTTFIDYDEGSLALVATKNIPESHELFVNYKERTSLCLVL